MSTLLEALHTCPQLLFTTGLSDPSWQVSQPTCTHELNSKDENTQAASGRNEPAVLFAVSEEDHSFEKEGWKKILCS